MSTTHAPVTSRDPAISDLTARTDAPPPERHLRFRPDIEGLRAVAIGMVVLYHAGWGRAAGGFLGVDVFFVLSGFLITGLLLDEIAATGRISLTNFWARRARRLLPAAAAVTLLVLVANVVVLSPLEQIRRAETVRAFAVYASNILFAVRSTDYFGGTATGDPMLHTWSLSVEEQFYLVFAPLMFLMAAWARSRGPLEFRRRFLPTIVALSLASLVGCLLLARRYPQIAFYALPARAWEFGLGAVCIFAIARATRRAAVLEVSSALAVLGLAASTVMIREGRSAPLGITTLLPTLSAAVLIVSGGGAYRTLVARALSTPPLRLVGRLSYSWYLWHWPVLVYLRELVPDASLRLNVGVAALSLIPAAITYRWLETPVRFSTLLQRHARPVVAGALVLAALTFGLGVEADRHANAVLSSPRFASIMAAKEKPRTYQDGCQVPLLATSSPPCTYGPGRNDTTIVLFGDSHSAHWFPAVDSVVSLRGWRLVNLTKTGCPSIDVVLNNLGRRYVECEQWRDHAIKRIVALRPALVLVSNDRLYDVVLDSLVRRTDTSGLARREWSRGLRTVLAALAPSGARLAVLEDTPQSTADVPRCLVKHVDQPEACDMIAARALSPASSGSELAAVQAVGSAAFISLNRFLCDRGRCPVMRDGVVRFQDSNHLSVRFAASLAPQLSAELSTVLQKPPMAR